MKAVLLFMIIRLNVLLIQVFNQCLILFVFFLDSCMTDFEGLNRLNEPEMFMSNAEPQLLTYIEIATDQC